MAKSRDKRKKNFKGFLIFMWIFIILLMAGLGVFVYLKKEKIGEDLGFTTKFTYKTNDNMEINALMMTYLDAFCKADQDTLKSCVTDPSQFDNMATVESRSRVITNYENVTCYTVDGKDKDATIVYVTAEITINNIESKPLDILNFYVVKKDGEYKIDNALKTPEVKTYMAEIDADPDIQELYKNVQKDQQDKASGDAGLNEFLKRISK